MNIITWDGQPISKPGVYAGIPIDRYHGADLCVGPSASSSILRTLVNKSPAHAWADCPLNPDAWEEKEEDGETVLVRKRAKDESEAFILGRGAHHLILGEADFNKHFVLRPATYPNNPDKAWSGNSHDCKNWLREQRRLKRTVLTQAQLEQIKGMARGLALNPLVQAGILNGLIEHSFIWQDAETGVWLKWRPDALPLDSLDFSDLKCVADVSDEAIERSIGAYGYHMQGGLGAIGCRELLGREMESFSLVCAEKTEPHCARVKQIRAGDLAEGEADIRLGLKLFARCLRTGIWPGPGGTQTDAEFTGLTSWDARRALERRERLEMELAA